MMTTKDEFELMEKIFKLLKDLPAFEYQRIIDWVQKKLDAEPL